MLRYGLPIAVASLVLAGCGTDAAPTPAVPSARPAGVPARQRHALEKHIRRLDLREIKLAHDPHSLGPPTVRVHCSRGKQTASGFDLRCNATLLIAVGGDAPIMQEAWIANADHEGRVTGSGPSEGYKIRAFFEADRTFDCQGEWLRTQDIAAFDRCLP